MKVLRHEEFSEGCDAACNGPYDGKWSKTMIGYGPEQNHFVLELTYNYGIGSYTKGNDFMGIHINSKDTFKKINKDLEKNECIKIDSPDGYSFYIHDENQGNDPVRGVSLATTDLNKAKQFWNGLLGLNVISENENELRMAYSDSQAFVHFVKSESVNHAQAYGRIAFALPIEELKPLEAKAKDAGYTILTPFITLSTPGKADVSVVIFADPDGHEICFVGEEGFSELSQVDDKADDLLSNAISMDKSDEWFAKKGKSKSQK